MIRLKITSIFNQSTIYLIFLILFILSFFSYWLIFLMLVLIIKFRNRFNLYLLFTLISIFSFSYYNKVNNVNNLVNDYKFVVEKHLKENDEYIIINNFKRYRLRTNVELTEGQIIVIKDEATSYRKNTRPFSFNNYHYNLGLNIFGYYRNPKLELTSDFSNIIKIRTILNNKFSNFNWYFNRDYTYQSELNYLFLFVCSTFSLNIIYKIFRKCLFYLDISNNRQNLIIVITHLFLTFIFTHIILVFYLIYLIFKTLINYYHLDVLKIDQYSLVVLFILLINPTIIFNFSLLIYLLIIYANLLLKRRYLTSLMILPFHFLWYQGINLVSIFIVLFLKEFKVFGLILLFLSFFISSDFLVLNLNIFNKVLNQISMVIPLIPYVNVSNNFFIYFYAIIIITHFFKLKYHYLIIILTLYLTINLVLIRPPHNRLYFLDVGQGNASIYLYKNEVIGIDCYDGVDEFLTNHKLKLDYLIITHNDYDHMRELPLLITKHSPILIVSENSSLSNINYYRKIKIGNNNADVLSDLDILFFPHSKASNENDNSLVFKINNSNSSLLFTGDISENREKLLIEKYGKSIKTNGLVIAHHGSNTSSSFEFLKYIDVNYALISVGYQNSYGMPSNNVIKRLDELQIKTYRTDHDGTIIVDFMNSDYKIKKVYKPYFKVGF